METITVKLPSITDVVFKITVEQDYATVCGNAAKSDNEELNAKVEDEIVKRLNNGDVWAWADVCVTASWHGLEGEAYMGMCTYDDEQDFIKTSGYYGQMKEEAYEELIETIKGLKGLNRLYIPPLR